MKVEKVRFDGPRPARRGRVLLLTIGAILLGALLLTWPSLLNRQPFLLSDTTNYVRGADAAAYKMLGVRTDWTDRFVDRYQPDRNPGTAAVAQKPATDQGRPVTLSGRSVYYGAFLYLADRIAGLRLAALLQAVLASVCLYLTVRRFAPRGSAPFGFFFIAALVLSIASPLAYLTGYLVPDLFSGLGILAAAHLLCGAPALTRKQRVFWFAILCLSALAHSSNVLILLILAAVLLIARLRWKVPDVRTLGLLACAIAVGIGGELLFYGSVYAFSGDPPVRPPFLMARLVADGPGYDYLRRTCPGNGFALCRHIDGLPRDSDTILWSEKVGEGAFAALGNDERRRIAAEEPRFVVSVIADRPFDVLRSSASSVLAQAGKWRLSEFNDVPSQSSELEAKLPPRIGRELAGSLAYRGAMPVRSVELTSLAATITGLALLLAALFRRDADRNMRFFLAILLLGIATDIIVCGALSTPHDRYSMRVLWLIPLGALVSLIQVRAGRRTAVATDASRSAAQKASNG